MEAPQNRLRLQIIIRGRVQGVYFRASAMAEARRLGITGWVLNRMDGAVEVVAEGDRASLDQLAAWCRQGPPGAQVSHLEIKTTGASGEFGDFRIKR